LKVRRQVADFALAGIAARVDLAGGVVRQARLVLTGVGMTPVRAEAAEVILREQRPDDEVVAAAADSVATSVELRSDRRGTAAYKRRVLRTITTRALRVAVRRANQRTMP
jgi:carbon-monoxide dehydrogenase medium subunit